MTAVATAPEQDAPRPSLARAEMRRLAARRFVRVLLLVVAVLYVLAVALQAATTYARTTPEALALAEQEVVRVVEEQDRFRQQCLDDPGRPAGLPDDEACGSPARAEDFRAEDFLAKRPFVLAQDLPDGAVPVGAGIAVASFLLGATYVGAEWSSRAMVALLFWEPRRLRVLAVKAGVLAGALALLASVAQGIWWLTARALTAGLGRTGDLPDGFAGQLLALQGRAVLLAVLVGLLGFGLAQLLRNTGAALGVAFVWFAVVENVVRGVRPAWQEWLLSDNAAALVLRGGNTVYVFDGATVDENGVFVDSGREIVLSNLHGGLVLGVAVALVLTAGAVLFARRDLH